MNAFLVYVSIAMLTVRWTYHPRQQLRDYDDLDKDEHDFAENARFLDLRRHIASRIGEDEYGVKVRCEKM